MNRRGSALLIIALAVVILLMIGAAFFMTGRSAAGAGSGGPATGPGFAVVYARTPGGISATLTVINRGTAELSEVRLVLADVRGMKIARPLPYMVGKLPAGAAVLVTLPYSGSAPAAGGPVQLNLQYDYREGLFTRGAGSASVSAVVP